LKTPEQGTLDWKYDHMYENALKEPHALFSDYERINLDAFEEGYESFKIGSLIHEARIEKGMTQEQLAEKVGTTKSYISKIENNIKEVRLSTLKKIIELGLGGNLELSIRL
jgi:DNA-binding XRE family transcriptional regulator